MKIKNFLKGIFFSFVLFNISLYATTTTEGNVVSQKCWITSEEEMFPVGDTRGRFVLTQKVVKRDCNLTITVQGPCKKWEITRENFKISPDSYDTYITNSNEDSMGQFLATINAYEQLEHIWSGWKGYCISGIETDFSWMSDPMFWATMAASYALDSANYESQMEAANASGATTANAAEHAMNNTAQNGLSNQIGGEVNDWSESLAESVNEALGTSLGGDLGKCLIGYGVNMAQTLKNYMQDDKIGCDPVDEFCGNDQGNQQDSIEEVMTMDTVKFNDMLNAHPEYKNYIVVLSEENGVTTFRFKRPDEMPEATSSNQEQIKEMQQKLKDMKFAISSAVNTAKFAACVGTNGTFGEGASYDNGSSSGLLSVRTGLNAAITYAPVDPLTKLALKIAVQLAYSFHSVDTCHNRKDAQAAGSRHLKTMESLPHGLCHFIESDCEKKFLGKCLLRGYHYCCYDQVLSRILVEQIKAQLGRGWAHCTGITLRDLKYVSFRQCTPQDKKLGFDGAHQVGNYDPTQSYQYKAKCIDFTDLVNYLKATVSKDIDLSDFKEVFDDLNSQAQATN